MSSQIELIKAIRIGRLPDVQAVLDAGAAVEMDDGQGDPGLPLGIACFMGHADIVRELVKRGAKANCPDNREPTAPLSLAIRGGKTAVIKVLIELGVEIPPDTQTGLTDTEITLARLTAQHARKTVDDAPVFEEIEMIRCCGTDTVTLDAEMIRAGLALSRKDKA